MDSKGLDGLFKKGSHSSEGSGIEAELLKHAKDFLHSHASGGQSAQQAQASQATGQTPAYQGGAPQQGGAPYQGGAPQQGGAPYQSGASAPAAGGSQKTNYKQVYGSAQTLYQGLQDKLGGKASTIDNHQLAEAAADVLKAANKAGFAKESQYAQYFDKAENYLHHYGAKGSAAATAPPPPVAPPAAAPYTGGPPPAGYPPREY